MKRTLSLILSLSFSLMLLFTMLGCQRESTNLSPAGEQRAEALATNFRKVLTDAPYGWHMRYFPTVSPGLNTDITENIKTSSNALNLNLLARRMGSGGYNLFLKFEEDGSMKVLSDIAYQSTDADNTQSINETYYTPTYNPETANAQYEIKIVEDLNLIITTPTMLDELSGLGINAGKRFSLVSQSPERIVLRSANYLGKDMEWIELTRLDIPLNKWQASMQQFIHRKENFRKRSFASGEQKEKRLCVLEISLTETGEIIYQSTDEYGYRLMDDRVSRTYNHNDELGKRIASYDRRQYELFYRNEQPERTIAGSDNSTYYTGLGSGYIATNDGVSFLPGFKLNDEIIFQHFKELPGKQWVAQTGPYTAKIHFIANQ